MSKKGKGIPGFSESPSHADVWSSGLTVPHILNIGTRWRKELLCPLGKALDRPELWAGRCSDDKTLPHP